MQLKDLAFPTVVFIVGIVVWLLSLGIKIDTTLVKLPRIDKQEQQRQLRNWGIILVLVSFVLYFFTSTTKPESINADSLTAAQSTISSFQTQLALPTAVLNTPSLQATAPLAGDTATPSPTITLTSTLTLTLISTPAPLTTAEFCLNLSNVIVRTDPGFNYPQKIIIKNPYPVSEAVCPQFDFRMPDNSWVRIAPNQVKSEYLQYELGWIPANQLRPYDIEAKLRIYKPDGVLKGKYCATNRNGVYVRTCPNDSCEITGTLYPRDCLIVDARSEDAKWVRISSVQEESKYSIYIGNWINSYYIAPYDFSAEWNSFLQYYIKDLQIASPPPTPGG